MRKIILLAATLLLSGCGLAQMAMRESAGPPQVTIKNDEFSRLTEIVGFGLYDNPLMGPFRNWMIRSFVDKQTGSVDHTLYVETHYDYQWPLFDAASDDETTDLKVMRAGKQVLGCTSHHREDCTYMETDVVTLDDGFLRRRAANGFRIKLYGRSGESSVFEVTPQMIALQLEAVDKLVGPKPMRSVSPAPH